MIRTATTALQKCGFVPLGVLVGSQVLIETFWIRLQQNWICLTLLPIRLSNSIFTFWNTILSHWYILYIYLNILSSCGDYILYYFRPSDLSISLLCKRLCILLWPLYITTVWPLVTPAIDSCAYAYAYYSAFSNSSE